MRSNFPRAILGLLLGTALLFLATQLLAQPPSPPRELPPNDFWRAWAVTGDQDSQLVVEGIYSQGGLGIVATLKEAAAVDNTTRVLLLELETETLPGNWPKILRPIPVQYHSKSYQSGQFDSVRIRYPSGASVAIEKVIEVDRADSTDPPDQSTEPRLVTKILNVDVTIETTVPPNLSIQVRGEVPTGGFQAPKLVRVNYVIPPDDGIQDYFLYATPPAGLATQVISEVAATDLWESFSEEAPWLKGVRIHGAGEGVVVKKL